MEARESGLRPASGAVVFDPNEGEGYDMGGASVTIKATGEVTRDTLFLAEVVLPAGFPGPPPHVHRQLHDMFYVLEGMLSVRLGDETRDAPPRTFVCVPPGVVHAFSNRSAEPVRFLNFNTPGGWEHYMRELATLAADGPPTPEAIGSLASKYDVELAE
jgi:mannose-6-phosphate isomerase-like protein (cupin superfamily)